MAKRPILTDEQIDELFRDPHVKMSEVQWILAALLHDVRNARAEIRELKSKMALKPLSEPVQELLKRKG